jgi:hypothetical protein
MTNTIKLYQHLTSAGVFDRVVNFHSPVQLPKDVTVKLRVSRVQVSDRIPNVYDGRAFGQAFDNTTVSVSTNVHAVPVTIKLEMGLYMYAATIEAALNAAINTLGWWQNPADPGLLIALNPVIDKFVLTIDSTKLAPAHGNQFKLSLQQSLNNSMMWRTLGFTPTTSFTVDGDYTSNVEPEMDTQGTACVVCCSIMPTRLVNEIYQPFVASIDFAGKTTTSDSVWPSGNVGNDEIVYSGSRTITQANFYVLTDEGAPMIFMNGRLSIELLFYW